MSLMKFGFTDHFFDHFFPTAGRRMNQLRNSLYSRNMMPTSQLMEKWTDMGTPTFTSTDFKDDGDKYLWTVELPGIDRENIKIDLDEQNRMLKISAEQRVEREEKGEDGQCQYKETRYERFERSIQVPPQTELEHIKASIKDNQVLSIEIPKEKPQAPTEAQTRHIPITTGEEN